MPALHFPLAFKHESFINAGDGKFPFVNVRFSKNHRPVPIEGATYYIRPTSSDKRTPFKIGKDISLAYTALIRREDGKSLDTLVRSHSESQSVAPTDAPRKKLAEAAREYIERSKQKSHRTYLGYRVAVNRVKKPKSPAMPFGFCTLHGGTSTALTSKPCGRSWDILILRRRKSTCVRPIRNAMSTAPKSMRRTVFLWSLFRHHFFVEPRSHEAPS